jgi:hypothetical protein
MEREQHHEIDYRELVTDYQWAVEAYRTRQTSGHAALVEERAALLTAAVVALPGRFALGQLVATPGAVTALGEAGHHPAEFLLRHKHGDFGELGPEDLAENERAVREGSRVFSSYTTRLDQKLWCITEWDRSVTTLLLPEEY